MKQINLGQKDIIHFVGIGGIGMSIAQIMRNMGLKYKEAIKIKIKIQLAVQNPNKSFYWPFKK